MDKNNTVTINGHLYDAITGMPVQEAAPVTTKKEAPKKTATRTATTKEALHAAPQRSQTLNRRVVKKNAPKSAAATRKSGAVMDIARSSRVAKFSPRPVIAPSASAQHEPKDKPAASHPIAERALARRSAKQTVASAPAVAKKTAKEIKEEAIIKALSTPTAKQPEIKSKPFFVRHSRTFIIIIAALVVLVGGSYLTLITVPGVSVSIAAAQAHIKATYPGYVPDGYSLSQPVMFSDGEVTLSFVSNGGSGGYTIKEARSSWDSSAVLDNIVKQAAGDNYLTTQDSGLTIYTYSGNAAWVNAGILYTITTQAPLSNEQVRNIATSL